MRGVRVPILPIEILNRFGGIDAQQEATGRGRRGDGLGQMVQNGFGVRNDGGALVIQVA